MHISQYAWLMSYWDEDRRGHCGMQNFYGGLVRHYWALIWANQKNTNFHDLVSAERSRIDVPLLLRVATFSLQLYICMVSKRTYP